VVVSNDFWDHGSLQTGTNLYFGRNHDTSDVGIAIGYTNAPAMPGSTNLYGVYSLTQVIESYSQKYNLNTSNGCIGYETNFATALDKEDPYWSVVLTSRDGEWTDAPRAELSVARWLAIENSFTAHIMFRPYPTNTSKAVPLFKVDWNWHGSATNFPWGKKSGDATVPSPVETTSYPIWTHIVDGVDTNPGHMGTNSCFTEY
jgi:hypothetical protein